VIFEEQLARKPDHYPWTEDFIRAMWEGHWTDREFSFCSDIHDFRTKLSAQEQEIIVRCLSAVAQIEVAVKTFWAKLGDNLPHPSIRDMGYVMANIECYAEGTEILTPTGWRNLFDIKNGDTVYQYNPEDGSLSETAAKGAFNKPYSGNMLTFGNMFNRCMVTPNHNMIVSSVVDGVRKSACVEAKNVNLSSLVVRADDEVLSYLNVNDDLVSDSGENYSWVNIGKVFKEEAEYYGRVGCVTVDTGALLTRLDGCTFIAGNCVHNSAYERLLEVLGIEDVFEKNLELEWMQGRVKYLRKYTHRFYKDSKKQFIYALILFTLFVENVSLFSQFYVINWFGRKNLLKDTNQQTNYTLKEEDLHAKAGIKLIQTIREEYPELFDEDLKNKILSEAVEAFKAESKIIDWMVNGIDEDLLSADILKEFVKSRINDSLEQIGFDSVFEVDSELFSKTMWFYEESLGNGMTDFFHARPVEYSKKAQSFSEEDLF
jgi:ribonucleoside-diphosphate reductase beta chain